jgi:DNA repair protein RecO (recombination protein O)
MRPFGERDSIGIVFTRDFGVMHGMLKGAQVAKKNRPLVGQRGAVSWNARLDSQLGAFHWEAEKNLSAELMSNPKLLGCMNSAFALIAGLVPEREACESLFIRTDEMLRRLAGCNGGSPADAAPHEIYLDWEKELLRELGYALDLTRCSNCRKTSDLNYLSPRTGRAVCDECAVPYLDRLFKLPLSLDVMRKFLDKICEQQGAALPPARKTLV